MAPHSGTRPTLPAAPQSRGKRNIQMRTNGVRREPRLAKPTSQFMEGHEKKRTQQKSVTGATSVVCCVGGFGRPAGAREL